MSPSSSSGLAYHLTMSMDSSATGQGSIASWGSIVFGQDQGNGWIRVGSLFLPKYMTSPVDNLQYQVLTNVLCATTTMTSTMTSTHTSTTRSVTHTTSLAWATRAVDKSAWGGFYLASLHDVCELDETRALCLPVDKDNQRYQDFRQRLHAPPVCCMVARRTGRGNYTFQYVGQQAGYYTLLVQAVFQGSLWGQYWDNAWYSGLPMIDRTDINVDFKWTDQPITAVASELVTARWTGFIQAPTTGRCTLYVKADDGVRLWVHGELRVDEWKEQTRDDNPEYWTNYDMVQDEFYSLRIDYLQRMGAATMRLMWQWPDERKTLVPSNYLFRGAALETAPYNVTVVPGNASARMSRLVYFDASAVRSSVLQRLYLEARDVVNNTVVNGTYFFEATFHGTSPAGLETRQVFRSKPLAQFRLPDDIPALQTPVRTGPLVVNDYLHFIDYVLQDPGQYLLTLELVGGGELYESPIALEVHNNFVHPRMCVVYGPGTYSFVAGEETYFTLEMRDAYDNLVEDTGDHQIDIDIVWQTALVYNDSVDDAEIKFRYDTYKVKLGNIEKGAGLLAGTYNVSYTAFLEGLYLLSVMVDGMLVRGQRDLIKANPITNGQNQPIVVNGSANPHADGRMTLLFPFTIPVDCPTGLLCGPVEFHVRDAYGNMIPGDSLSQVRFFTVTPDCNTSDRQDAKCAPIDEGQCIVEEGLLAVHSCSFVPTRNGTAVVRVLVNGVDASSANYKFQGGSQWAVLGLVRGPFPLFIYVGAVNTSTTFMKGPGLREKGNVVGYAQPVLVQLRDQYGNYRPASGPEFQDPATYVLARLVDERSSPTILEVKNNFNGSFTVLVNTFIAGFYRLEVKMGRGCRQKPPRDPCQDINGSLSPLLRWDPRPVTARGTTCVVPWNTYVAGNTYHFNCTGRDEFGNPQIDPELDIHAEYKFKTDPSIVGLDQISRGWWRNVTGSPFVNLLQFPGTYDPANGLYHFYPRLERQGTYVVRVELAHRGGLRAWYHYNIGFNSLILLNPPEVEEGLPGEPTYTFTRIDRFGLGDLDMDKMGLATGLGLDEFWSAEWRGYFVPWLTGNHTIAFSGGGNLLLELDGIVVYDGLHQFSFDEAQQSTTTTIAKYLTAEEPVQIRLAYEHSRGPAFIRFALSMADGPDRFWETPVPDDRWFYRRTVLRTTSEGRPPQEGATAICKYERTSGPASDIEYGVLHGTLWNDTLARAVVRNKLVLTMRDAFGNFQAEETPATLGGFLLGPPQVDFTWTYIGRGRYQVYFVPIRVGPSWIHVTVGGQPILGSPFMKIVLPGPTSIDHSLVVGQPKEVIAGVESCWLIVLRDDFLNKRMSDYLYTDSITLESVTTTDPQALCNTTTAPGTWRCCMYRTVLQNIRGQPLGVEPFCSQINDACIDDFVDLVVHPYPVDSTWPRGKNVTGNWSFVVNTSRPTGGHLGPYFFPIVTQAVAQDFTDSRGRFPWPTQYYRLIQRKDYRETARIFREVQLIYSDGFGNRVLKDNAVVLLCEVHGPHTLGQPRAPTSTLPYTLNTVTGIFTVQLDFQEAGIHQVWCYTERQGGLNVRYYDNAVWDGEPLHKGVSDGVNVRSVADVAAVVPGTEHVSLWWDGQLRIPLTANYTISFDWRARAVTIHINGRQLVSRVTSGGSVIDGEYALGRMVLEEGALLDVQIAWSTNEANASVGFYWQHDRGLRRSIIPASALYNSKDLLVGYPVTIQVTDVPGPAETFFKQEPLVVGQVTLTWSPPVYNGGRAIQSYRLRHDDGLGGDFSVAVKQEVGYNLFSEVIDASQTTITYPILKSPFSGNLAQRLDATRVYRFALTASNDDRVDRDYLLDGGGEGTPRILVLQPAGEPGRPLKPVMLDASVNSNGTGQVKLLIAPPANNGSGGLLLRYRLFSSVMLQGVSPPPALIAEGPLPIDPVDINVTGLMVGRSYKFQASFVYQQKETNWSEALALVCCTTALPGPPTHVRRLVDFKATTPVQTNDRITVIWDPPLFQGDHPVTHYRVTLTPVTILQNHQVAHQSAVVMVTDGANDRRVEFNGLAAGVTYAVRAVAITAAGMGPWTEDQMTMASGYSLAPRNLSVASQTIHEIVIAWVPPLRVGAGGIRSYTIYAIVPTGGLPAPWVVGEVEAGTTQFSFQGWEYMGQNGQLQRPRLVPGQAYNLTVQAVNYGGVGPMSTADYITGVACSKPGAPQVFTADLTQLSKGVAALSWRLPEDNGGDAVRSYHVERKKQWSGAFLVQCARLRSRFDPKSPCIIDRFNSYGVGNRNLIMEDRVVHPNAQLTGTFRVFAGRVAVRNFDRTLVSSVRCNSSIFGDPLYPTPPHDFVTEKSLGIPLPKLRVCYALVEACVDEPRGWYDGDSNAFNCSWYAVEGRCESFGGEPSSAGLWGRTASQACCACGGGNRSQGLRLVALDGGLVEFNSSFVSVNGTLARYADGITSLYYGRVNSTAVDPQAPSIKGSVDCAPYSMGGQVATVTNATQGMFVARGQQSYYLIAASVLQFCYFLEIDDGQWRDLMSPALISIAMSYTDINAVQGHRYYYRIFAMNQAVSGPNNYSTELSLVLGGLPDPPDQYYATFPPDDKPYTPPQLSFLPTPFDDIRVAWKEVPFQALPVLGYRVYVDSVLVYDGADDPITKGFTLFRCELGRSYDIEVTAINDAGETMARAALYEQVGYTRNFAPRFCAGRPKAPDPPAIVNVSCINPATTRGPIQNSITIRYFEPKDNGGRVITGYRVQRAEGNSLAFRGVGPIFPLSKVWTTFIDDNDLDGYGPIGLNFSQVYKYRVIAINGQDDWNDGFASDFITVPCGMPTTLFPTVITRDSPPTSRTAINLTWPAIDLTNDPNAVEVTGYILYGCRDVDGPPQILMNGNGTPAMRTFLHTGLEPGMVYRYQVAAATKYGDAQPRSPLFRFLAAVAPAAPKSLYLLLAAITDLVVAWTPPSDDGDSPVQGFILSHDGGNASAPSLSYVTNVSALVLKATLRGLPPSSEVRVRVLAFNSMGLGPATSETFRTATAKPHISLAPAALALVPGQGEQGELLTASAGELSSCRLLIDEGRQDGQFSTLLGLSAGALCGQDNKEVSTLIFGTTSEIAFESMTEINGRNDAALGTVAFGLPPAPPRLLRAAFSNEQRSIFLQWAAGGEFGNSEPVRAVVVYRFVQLAGEARWQQRAVLPATAVEFNDTEVHAGEVFSYQLVVVSGAGSSEPSDIVTLRKTVPPELPAAIVWPWTSDVATLNLGWTEMEFSVSRTHVYSTFGMSSGGPFSFEGLGAYNNVTLKGLTAEQWYSLYVLPYTVAAANGVAPVVKLSADMALHPPTAHLGWASCRLPGRRHLCDDYLAGVRVKACALIKWTQSDPGTPHCPLLGYRVLRNNTVISGTEAIPSSANQFLDASFQDDFDCFANSSVNRPSNDAIDVPRQRMEIYTVQALNCRGWSEDSGRLVIPVVAPVAQVCGMWRVAARKGKPFECAAPGLQAVPVNGTALRFNWTLLQDVLLDGDDTLMQNVSLSQLLIGSADPQALQGYQLMIDDGLGGPFQVAYDGRSKFRTSMVEVSDLLPGRVYSAFVRALGWTGVGDASNVVHVRMKMFPPMPVNVSATYCGTRCVRLSWEYPKGFNSEVNDVNINGFFIERALEKILPGEIRVKNAVYPSWIPILPVSVVAALQLTVEVRNVEPNFRYAFRVRALSENGESATSVPLVHWCGSLPERGPYGLTRIRSPDGIVSVAWDIPPSTMLGAETMALRDFRNFWGYRGYVWERGQIPVRVFDNYGDPNTSHFDVANLSCGGTYFAAVSIVTAVGEGPMSPPLEMHVARQPGVVQNFFVSATTLHNITLSWDAPADTGCVPIYTYRVWRYNPMAGYEMIGYSQASNGSYQAAAQDYTDSGECWRSQDMIPGEYRDIAEIRYDVNDPPVPLTCYCIPERRYAYQAGAPPHCLVGGNAYTYQVQACVLGFYSPITVDVPYGSGLYTMPMGCGPLSYGISNYTANPPSQPRDVRPGTAGGSNILISWYAPVDDGMNGTTVLEYNLDVNGGQGSLPVENGRTTQTSFMLTGLLVQRPYVVQVTVRNVADYRATSAPIRYWATLAPATPRTPTSVPTSASVGNAFAEHPMLASTAVIEGVTVRFVATQRRGLGWAFIVKESFAPLVTPAGIKAGAGAVGGPTCSRMASLIDDTVTLWRLGSDDNPDDPDACMLECGKSYSAFVYVEGPSGALNGTLSGPVPILVQTSKANTFASLPFMSSPLTSSGVSISFTARHPGYGWAMVVGEDIAASITATAVVAGNGALGSTICRWEEQVLYGLSPNTWVLANCMLTPKQRYFVFVYISGVGGHLDGDLANATSLARPASNSYSSYPTIATAPNGDGLTLQFRTHFPGYAWVMITPVSAYTTLDIIKEGVGAVGGPDCSHQGIPIDTNLQSFRLQGCFLNSGPQYLVHLYVEGVLSSGGDGSFAGQIAFQVTPSNDYSDFPSVLGQVTGLGFKFTVGTIFAGRLWCVVVDAENNFLATIATVKAGVNATGKGGCRKAAVSMVGAGVVQDVELTGCGLVQLRKYMLYVYVEDIQGFDDGVATQPISVRVGATNSFLDSPVVLGVPQPNGFSISLIAAGPGAAWGMLFASMEEVDGFSMQTFLEELYPNVIADTNMSCALNAIPVLALNVSVLDFVGCGLNYSQTYWGIVYIEGVQRSRAGALSLPIPVTLPPSVEFLTKPRVTAVLAQTATVIVSADRPALLWVIIVSEDALSGVNISSIKAGVRANGLAACRLIGVPANRTESSFQLTSCKIVAGKTYYAFAYIEAAAGGGWHNDGVTSEPMPVYVTPSNGFITGPRIGASATTERFDLYFQPNVTGRIWAIISQSSYEPVMDFFTIKDLPYIEEGASMACARDAEIVRAGQGVLGLEFIFCKFKRAPISYIAHIYVEDMNGMYDGTLATFPITIPGITEVANNFYLTPYVSTGPTIDGGIVTFQTMLTGYVWGAIVAVSDLQQISDQDNWNGNYNDPISIKISQIKAGGPPLAGGGGCWKNATYVPKDTLSRWNFFECGLLAGKPYKVFLYATGMTMDNGRMMSVLIVPPYSNTFASAPMIVQGPTGDGLTVKLTVSRSPARLWLSVKPGQAAAPTVSSAKATAGAAGGPACQRQNLPVAASQPLLLALSDCQLGTETPYQLVAYVEDDQRSNDGVLFADISFVVPVTNDLLTQPVVVGDPGLDEGVTLQFEATRAGYMWMMVVSAGDADKVTYRRIKSAPYAIAASCAVTAQLISAEVQRVSLRSCPLTYLGSYAAFVYVEGLVGHLDGRLSNPTRILVGPSNAFVKEPVLLPGSDTDRVGLLFTPSKAGMAWMLLRDLALMRHEPTRAEMRDLFGAYGAATCQSVRRIEPKPQAFNLTGCALSSDLIYGLYVYIEDFRSNLDGEISRPVPVKVRKTNTFLRSPILLGAATTDGLLVEYAAAQPSGMAWGDALQAVPPKKVNPYTLRSLSSAVGQPSCRRSAQPINNETQLWNLTGCGFQRGTVYYVYAYVEGSGALPGSGLLSGAIYVYVPEVNASADLFTPTLNQGPAFTFDLNAPGSPSNAFMEPVGMESTAIISQVDLRFKAAREGNVWAVVVPTKEAPRVNKSTIKVGHPVIGFRPCNILAEPLIGANLTVRKLAFRDCALVASIRYVGWPFETYRAVVYIEDASGASGMLSAPVKVDIIATHSNWFREDPRLIGSASPNGITLGLRAAAPAGRMWAMLTRYTQGMDSVAVRLGLNAVGDRVRCRASDVPFNASFQVFTFSGCSLEPGVYYYASIYISGQSGALDGTLSPPLELYVPTFSNSFLIAPRLNATPTENDVRISFQAVQEFGRLWVIMMEASVTIDAATIKKQVLLNDTALGGPACRRNAMKIGQQQEVVLLAGCRLEQSGVYKAAIYAEDQNGNDDGTMVNLVVAVRPRAIGSNLVASGPVLAATPQANLVQLRFAAARRGRFNAFIIPTYFNYKVNAADAQFLTIREILPGTGYCRKVNQLMEGGTVDVNLTNCGLALNLTLYSAFIYVEDETGNVGDVSHAAPLNFGPGGAPVSNTFVAPLPELIEQLDEPLPTTVRFNVAARNSGQIWVQVFEAQYAQEVKRYLNPVTMGLAYEPSRRRRGVVTIEDLKDWSGVVYNPDAEPNPWMGPSFDSALCRKEGEAINATQYNQFGLPIPTVLELSNCTFKSNVDYKIVVYVQDYMPPNSDYPSGYGEITSLSIAPEFINASNFFLAMPSIVGVPLIDAMNITFKAMRPGQAWCAIVKKGDELSVSGARVLLADLTLGGPACCRNTTGTPIGADVQNWTLSGCGLSAASSYYLFVYVITDSLGTSPLEGTLSAGLPFNAIGPISYIRLAWVQFGQDEGGPIDQYRIFLNGTQAYDDHGFRTQLLEQEQGGIPPNWIRVVDIACSAGQVYQVTLKGHNEGGWSQPSTAVALGCLLVPGSVSNVHFVPAVPLSTLPKDEYIPNQLVLAWDPPYIQLGSTVTYQVYRDDGTNQGLYKLNAEVATPLFADHDFLPGRYYAYRICAVNSFGAGPLSPTFIAKSDSAAPKRLLSFSARQLLEARDEPALALSSSYA